MSPQSEQQRHRGIDLNGQRGRDNETTGVAKL